MRQTSDLEPTGVGVATDSFLRALYPRDTAKHVSTDTGWKLATIEKMLERRSSPSTPFYIALALAYGPPFLVATMPQAPAWLDKASRAERQADLDAKIAALLAEREALR